MTSSNHEFLTFDEKSKSDGVQDNQIRGRIRGKCRQTNPGHVKPTKASLSLIGVNFLSEVKLFQSKKDQKWDVDDDYFPIWLP